MEVLPKPGDKSKLLLAGQSSGAEMIRSLLSTPDASGLFSKVALHSAPMNFKDYSASTSAQIGRVATKLLQNNTLASLQSLSVEAMLGVQANLTDGDYLTETVPGLSSIGEFFRPHVEEKRQDFGYYPQNHKPLPIALPMLFTSVKNEGCAKVNDLWVNQFHDNWMHIKISQIDRIPCFRFLAPTNLTKEEFEYTVQSIVGQTRGIQIVKSNLYNPDLRVRLNDQDAVRNTLEKLGSDFIW